jgi:hypothetical protein
MARSDARAPRLPMRPLSTAGRRLLAGLAFLLVVLLGSSCGDDSAAGGSGSASTADRDPRPTGMPAWLERVFPPDGANSPERAVEVDYGLLGDRQEIRVVIDGIDVTAQLEGIDRASDDRTLFPSPGQLRYDPRAIERPLVSLEPGAHSAEVRLVELDEFGASLETIDEYGWSFTVQ